MTYEDALTALADPTRRRLFESLALGPRPVGALAVELGVSQPAVSQHLAVLRRAHLVRSRAEGTRRYYEPDRAGIDAVRDYFDRYWAGVLDAYARSFDTPDP
jgi:DNA-binding transcriptional ArsR family regulator